MSNKFFNFYYDPSRQGFDANTWVTRAGVPVVVNNQLKLDNASIIHFADLLRADITFNISMPAPTAGDTVRFGLVHFPKNSFAYFGFTDDVFTVETGDGEVTDSITLDWNTDWTDTNTEFRINWEAGAVRFYINGIMKETMSLERTSLGAITRAVPNDPMSVTITSQASGPLLLNYLEGKGIQTSNLIV